MKKEIEYLQKKIRAIEYYIERHYINGEYTGEYYPNIATFIFYFIIILFYLLLFCTVAPLVSFKEIAKKITTPDFILSSEITGVFLIFMSLFIILVVFLVILLPDIISDFKCYLAYKYFCKIFNIRNEEKNLFEIFEQAKKELGSLITIKKYPKEKNAKIYTSNHNCYANNYDNNNNQVLDIRIEVDLKK